MNIYTNLNCVTGMKQYENKSLEVRSIEYMYIMANIYLIILNLLLFLSQELRFEDYSCNRKGPGGAGGMLVSQAGGGMMGGATSTAAGLFSGGGLGGGGLGGGNELVHVHNILSLSPSLPLPFSLFPSLFLFVFMPFPITHSLRWWFIQYGDIRCFRNVLNYQTLSLPHQQVSNWSRIGWWGSTRRRIVQPDQSAEWTGCRSDGRDLNWIVCRRCRWTGRYWTRTGSGNEWVDTTICRVICMAAF